MPLVEITLRKGKGREYAESVAAAAMAMDRRDIRLVESGGLSRRAPAPGAAPEGRRTLDQPHRRTVQPRRAASRARRDS